MTTQVEMIRLDDLIAVDYRYRYFKRILNESLCLQTDEGLDPMHGTNRVWNQSPVLLLAVAVYGGFK